MAPAFSQKIPKDHYVPQFYLDAFATEGSGQKNPHINLYTKQDIIPARIKDVASEKHFYTFKDKKTGESIRAIDEIFTSSENAAAPVIRKIIQEQEINLNSDERRDLAIFFTLLAVRTPAFMNSVQSFEEEATKEFMAIHAMDKNSIRKSMSKIGITLDEKELKDLHEVITEKKYTISYGNKIQFIVKGLEISEELAEYYYNQKHWHLLISSSDRVFITSDNPVSVYRPIFIQRVLNAGFKNGTLIIPISPKLAILMRDIPYKKPIITANSRITNEINKNTMKFSNNYVFSNLKSKQILETFRQTENRQYQKTTVKRHKWAPYIFMSQPLVPEEPIF